MRSLFLIAATALLLAGGALLAQETIALNTAQLSEGITLRVDGAQLDNSAQLIVRGGAGENLALLALEPGDGEPVWLRQDNAGEVVANTARWSFDPESGLLRVDLSGVKGRLGAGNTVTLRLIPVNFRRERLTLTLSASGDGFETAQPALNSLQTLTIDINETEQ